ncbi:MAG: 30S ribosomal protein S8 [bacterium]
MSMNDPIADYLTRIRNAIIAKHSKVDIPASNILKKVSEILVNEGYIKNFTIIDDDKQGTLRLYLKYVESGKNVIRGLKRVSKPGIRQYVKVTEIPRVLNGLGVSVLTTPKGVLTGKEAKKNNVGGEVLFYIY